MTGGIHVLVSGSGFIKTPSLSCMFGNNPPSAATCRNASASAVLDCPLLDCVAPPWSLGQPSELPVEISLNGVDFTDNDVLFTYTDVPALV